MTPKKLVPVHPGEILLEEFLAPMGLSQYRLAMDISVPPRRINEIVHGKRAISADTALRLACYFGTSERFWLNLQAQFDLDVERDRLGRKSRQMQANQLTATKPPLVRTDEFPPTNRSMCMNTRGGAQASAEGREEGLCLAR
jgi:addiction module HigA family antidote